MILQFGPYKGEDIEDVPDKYLLHLYEQGKTYGKLKAYLDDNIDAIRHNIAEARRRGLY